MLDQRLNAAFQTHSRFHRCLEELPFYTEGVAAVHLSLAIPHVSYCRACAPANVQAPLGDHKLVTPAVHALDDACGFYELVMLD